MPRLARAEANATFILDEEGDIDDEDDEEVDYTQNNNQFQTQFSQIDPDQSQFLDTAKENEIKKLNALNPTARNRIVTDLSRILLFRALSGDVIDKSKCVTEALGENMKKERVATAVLDEAQKRLKDVFGFDVRRVPKEMERDLPGKFKNRLYLISGVTDDPNGTHSLNIHSAHMENTVEKGVLMMILAFAFCKGTSQVRSGQMKGAGKKTRWITEHQLYNLLHRVDDNIPSEPPSAEGKKKSRQSVGGGRKSLGGGTKDDGGGVGETPDIDTLLERFVQLDYLLKDKIEEPGEASNFAGEDGKVLAYAMGPRAAMEVGRKQIIHFCSDVLGEQPDPTMLAEVDEGEEDDDDEEDEGEEEVVEEDKPKKRRKK